MGLINARTLGTRTVTPETLTLAAQLAGFSRGDRRHRTRPFYCLGGHTLVVADCPRRPALTTRRFPPPWSAEDIGAAFLCRHRVWRPSVRLAGPARNLKSWLRSVAPVSPPNWPDFCIQCRPLGGRGYGDNRKCVRTATMWLAHAVARECSLRGQHSTLNYRWRHSNVSRVVLP